MKLRSKAITRLSECSIALCFTAFAAQGAPVSYSFTATTRATMGSPSHTEEFHLVTPDFLPLVTNGGVISFLHTDPGLISCVACAEPPVQTLHFLRGAASDLVQFRDADGILRPYFFPLGALSSAGVYDTLPGINVNVGRLAVAETEAPEPSTVGLALTGLAMAAMRLRRHRRNN